MIIQCGRGKFVHSNRAESRFSIHYVTHHGKFEPYKLPQIANMQISRRFIKYFGLLFLLHSHLFALKPCKKNTLFETRKKF